MTTKKNCKLKTMESGDHYKNGASPKSQTIRRNLRNGIFYLLIILSVSLLQSCVMMTLRGNHALLNNNVTYSGVDVQLTMPSSPSFNIDCYAGAGKLDFTNTDLGIQHKDSASFTGASVGIGASYYFMTKSRLQPFAALEVHDLIGTGEENYKIPYITLTPKVGIRYYLSNRIALNGTLGYQMGRNEVENVTYNLQGLMPSIGITFVVSAKEH
jgi:hypothetical protein